MQRRRPFFRQPISTTAFERSKGAESLFDEVVFAVSDRSDFLIQSLGAAFGGHPLVLLPAPVEADKLAELTMDVRDNFHSAAGLYLPLSLEGSIQSLCLIWGSYSKTSGNPLKTLSEARCIL